ncbi:MAG: PepSY domain-containing protein [Aureliella sp.]
MASDQNQVETEVDFQPIPSTGQASGQEQNTGSSGKRTRKSWITKFTIFLRRVHLYAGLFLLPWVFLYGITGAMYNHEGLFPESEMISVPAEKLTEQPLMEFPSPEELAGQVVAQLQDAAPDHDIQLAANHGAEYNNDLIYQVEQEGRLHAIHVNPMSKDAYVAIHPENQEREEKLLTDVKNLRLSQNPYQKVKDTVPAVLEAAGIEKEGAIQPRGWCKLNFIADVDGEPARVTYVLRDGHVDTIRYQGQDGMSPRSFFLRLHTTHGQPPHWNGRMYWSVILDIMAIAMVTWGLTGLVMWWQLKRTRLIGAIVMLASIGCAAWMYLSMLNFYATTKL